MKYLETIAVTEDTLCFDIFMHIIILSLLDYNLSKNLLQSHIFDISEDLSTSLVSKAGEQYMLGQLRLKKHFNILKRF